MQLFCRQEIKINFEELANNFSCLCSINEELFDTIIKNITPEAKEQIIGSHTKTKSHFGGFSKTKGFSSLCATDDSSKQADSDSASFYKNNLKDNSSFAALSNNKPDSRFETSNEKHDDVPKERNIHCMNQSFQREVEQAITDF